jgi:hypothetical protein
MVSPERANEIAVQVREVVQRAAADAAVTSRRVSQEASNQILVRASCSTEKQNQQSDPRR